jgi:hypothetical protein
VNRFYVDVTADQFGEKNGEPVIVLAAILECLKFGGDE